MNLFSQTFPIDEARRCDRALHGATVGEGSPWLLIPAAVSLALFVWLLTLHPTDSGRVYAAYGGVYVAVALIWLWRVDGAALSVWDVTGVAVALLGMGIIVWGGWQT